ncbi:hypothetical protein BKA66DRAFT_594692 [Pyrenochaeta sp. MPI-SDFR-AT-0127]|nr:hypothetical protein BKA66DRAFT_594692 [Pyrenochaeta sp. MPI-SDFR-AT-0127]
MLYVANVGCSCISVCLVVRKMLPGIVANYSALVLACFCGIWTVSGVLVSAFPCDLPAPWDFLRGNKCYNLEAFGNYIGTTNLAIEFLLIAIPLFIWNVPHSIIAALSAHLYFFNSFGRDDYTYGCWASVLCQQIAQNFSVISACLPCLHPFIHGILARTTELETINIKYSIPPRIQQLLVGRATSFDSTRSGSSRASITHFAREAEEPYCRPLATYGFDQSSTHVHSQSVMRFPANVARPVFTSAPPDNVFNRRIEMPRSRPVTSSSSIASIELPSHLGECGVLPIMYWDSESNISDSSRRSTPLRHPTAEYIFNRSMVISVPEEMHLYDDGIKQFAPPVPSPRLATRTPRAF